MIGKGLSLDQAPPFMAPFIFFIASSVFGSFAGLVVLLSDPSLFMHRLAPESLAVVHLLTIGFFSMVMMGSMQQMLPVLAGVQFNNPMRNAKIILFLTAMGALLFFFGFYFSVAILIDIAAVSLLTGITLFVFIVLKALVKVKNRNDSVRAMAYAVVSFLVAALFGVVVGFSYGGLTEYSEFFASFHIVWVFFGWIMLLVMGVSFQVIPMFYVSSSYPKLFRYEGVMAIFAFLVFITLSKATAVLDYEFVHMAVKAAVILLFIGYALITVKKIKERKRAVVDTSLLFWYLAMGSLTAGLLIWFYGSSFESEIMVDIAGIILGIGFLFSLINGMLYKIVPFLVWFHLSNMGHFNAPTMRDILPDKKARMQFYAHALSFFLFLAGAIIEPYIYKAAGLFFTISNIMLFMNLYNSAKVYLKKKDEPVPTMNFDMSAFIKK